MQAELTTAFDNLRDGARRLDKRYSEWKHAVQVRDTQLESLQLRIQQKHDEPIEERGAGWGVEMSQMQQEQISMLSNVKTSELRWSRAQEFQKELTTEVRVASRRFERFFHEETLSMYYSIPWLCEEKVGLLGNNLELNQVVEPLQRVDHVQPRVEGGLSPRAKLAIGTVIGFALGLVAATMVMDWVGPGGAKQNSKNLGDPSKGEDIIRYESSNSTMAVEECHNWHATVTQIEELAKERCVFYVSFPFFRSSISYDLR